MSSPYVSHITIQNYDLWKRIKGKPIPISFNLEITARCNNNCRHCYINLPPTDSVAKQEEMSLKEIENIAEKARDLGCLWCLITGGEPLLRDDFADIYMMLKKKGFLVSVFTNACLITPEHITLFQDYPPRDIEVSVYGATEATYEQVTRRKGSYKAFRRGLDLMFQNGIKVRLKAMALRSNVHEFHEISEFCRMYTKDFYRFDHLLHLRFDRDENRNNEIQQERLTPEEIATIERADPDRLRVMVEKCDEFIMPENIHTGKKLFRCGAGVGSFTISYNGIYRLCSSLWHPDCISDLRKGTLAEAWYTLPPRIHAMKSERPEFLDRCCSCGLINLCLWCPAHAYLETGELDAWCSYFCDVAHARVRVLRNGMHDSGNRD